GALALVDGQAAAHLSAPTALPFTATGGAAQLFGFGEPAASPGGGSYDVEITPASGPAVISVARGVSVAGGPLTAYSFQPSVTAGTDTLHLTDFEFPSALASVTLAAVQSGTILGTPLKGTSSADIKVASGPLSLVA